MKRDSSRFVIDDEPLGLGWGVVYYALAAGWWVSRHKGVFVAMMFLAAYVAWIIFGHPMFLD